MSLEFNKQCDHMVHAVETTPYSVLCMLKCVWVHMQWKVISGLRSVDCSTNTVRIKGFEPWNLKIHNSMYSC